MYAIKAVKAFLFIITVLLSHNIYSQDDFFYLDYAIFKGNDNKAIIEIYYSFDQRYLLFVKKDNGYEANGKIDLKISDKVSGNVIINEAFNIPVGIDDTSGYNRNNRLIGQLNVQLDSGYYGINVTASDFNNEAVKFIDTVSFKLSRFTDEKVTSSSLQLANNVYKSDDKTSIFYKNSLEVEPNPSRLFGNNIFKLFYYIELYNLDEGLIGENYTVNVSLLSSDDKVLKQNKKDYKRNNESRVEIGSFDIKDMPSGKYSIKLLMSDKDNTLTDINKVFYIYNAGVVSKDSQQVVETDTEYLLSDISKMSEDGLMSEYEKAGYILADNFKEKFESIPDLEGKKRYYFSFWKSVDPTPGTPYNEYKKEYFEKVQYADKYLKSDVRKGWETDRGRVYIVFGKPTEIERFPFEANTRAYEIWRYDNIEGGVEFVFVDISNDGGTFELVHSTKKNEIRNDDWKNRYTIIRN